MPTPSEDIDLIDREAAKKMSESAIPMLRTSLGITYVWFGILKIVGESPVSDLVGKMSFGLPAGLFVKLMGAWETALGIGLLFRITLRFTLVLYFLQLLGAFMVFFAHPGETFRKGNPLLLTERGEFIVKNLVLLAAGVAVGSTVRHGREELLAPEGRPPAEAREVRIRRGE